MADVNTTKYVKFSRGSQLAYNNLPTKDFDTLYFIQDSDTQKYTLYLGDKFVTSDISSVAELEDILLTELGDGELLVYDAESEKWVNKTPSEAIGIMQGATAETQGKAGLVPAPGIGETNLFLRSDGQWAEVTGGAGMASTTKVFQATVEGEETQLEAIERIVGATALTKGDIAIVKAAIADEVYEHTAYVYDGTNWAAMSGNYSAENVYFTSDFTFTEKIGTVQELTNGHATKEAAGKNIQEFFTNLFKQVKNPNVESPSGALEIVNSSTPVEAGKTIAPQFQTHFSSGNYEFGPEVGLSVTITTKDESDDTTIAGASGTFDPILIGDEDVTRTFTTTFVYTDGAIPVNNVGTAVPELQIVSGTCSANETVQFSSYRKCFYGTLADKAETLTSSDIRGLGFSTSSAVENGTQLILNIAGGTGVKRIVFAYPATIRDLTEVIDHNDSDANIVSAFTQKIGTVMVEGADGYEAIEYKVWIQDFAEEYSDNNYYIFKI